AAFGVCDDGITTRQGGQWTDRFEAMGECLQQLATLFDDAAHAAGQGSGGSCQALLQEAQAIAGQARAEALVQTGQQTFFLREALLHGTPQACFQFVEALSLLLQAPAGMLQAPGEQFQMAAFIDQALQHELREAALLTAQLRQPGALVWRDQFSGSRGCGSTQVSHEVGYAEIGFVAHGGDHGQARGMNGPRQGFVVEGPQVFQGTTTARQQDQVDVGQATGTAVHQLQRLAQLAGSRLALYAGGHDSDTQQGETTLQHAQDVVDGRPGGRG